VDAFIAGVGTGGTLMGVGRRLKEANPRRSSSPSSRTLDSGAGLRNLEEGFIPLILDLQMLDGKVLVRQDAFLRPPRSWLAKRSLLLCRRVPYSTPRSRLRRASEGGMSFSLRHGG
jgi:cysteine synthase B